MVRRLLKSAQQRESGPVSSDNNNTPPARDSKDDAAGEDVKTGKTQKGANGKKGGKPAKKKERVSRDGAPKGGGREGEGRTLVPSWLFAHLPFHDDESFAVFFCDVLLGSERLAVRFG